MLAGQSAHEGTLADGGEANETTVWIDIVSAHI